jgi:ubiquinone/menaquinone biosynthesis C-methylase UbiE
LLVTSPRPNDENLSGYYQSDNYISHSGQSTSLVNWVYLQAREFSLQWKKRLINRISRKGTLLDIGCGTGEFLQTMKANGWEVSGIEPSTSAREKSEKLVQQPMANSLEDITGTFKAVTLWHVLEHVPDLNKTLTKINQFLSEDGKLIIAVPNHQSRDAKKYQQYWAGYDVPRHLWHFNQNSMALLLQNHGFTIDKTIPMKLDAYYVSMLSEKYANGNSGIRSFITGLNNGFVSNRAASQSGDYSSLIYIAKK